MDKETEDFAFISCLSKDYGCCNTVISLAVSSVRRHSYNRPYSYTVIPIQKQVKGSQQLLLIASMISVLEAGVHKFHLKGHSHYNYL
ncbi:Hypothetical predicted protein [Octopus vulgaris]|uniref:Uncharacterized protein n=1 Tax=Octopus vulgaris TaxID=6645 RepID=A0AA36B3X5_OCTVU|nr:Hypothetical predicted protein [Octopus vulgaris]